MPLDKYEGSVFSRIVGATADVVTDAVQNHRFPRTPVYRRKRPVLLKSDLATWPCIVVSPGPEGERIVFEAFGGVVVYGYPVACAVFCPGTSVWTADARKIFDEAADVSEREYADVNYLKEVVRQAVFRLDLEGAPSVFNVEIVPAPAIEMSAGSGPNAAMFNVSGVLVTYHSLESRAA